MSELTILNLRLGFLVILWCFVLAIVYALRSDLFGAPARRMRDRKKAEPEPMVAAALASPRDHHVPVEPQPSAATVTDLPSAGSTGQPDSFYCLCVAEGTQLTT